MFDSKEFQTAKKSIRAFYQALDESPAEEIPPCSLLQRLRITSGADIILSMNCAALKPSQRNSGYRSARRFRACNAGRISSSPGITASPMMVRSGWFPWGI